MYNALCGFTTDPDTFLVLLDSRGLNVLESKPDKRSGKALIRVSNTKEEIIASGLIYLNEVRQNLLDKTTQSRLVLDLPERAKVGEQILVHGGLYNLEGDELLPITDIFDVPISSDRPTSVKTIQIMSGEVVTHNIDGDPTSGVTLVFRESGYYKITEENLNSRLAGSDLFILFDDMEITVSE